MNFLNMFSDEAPISNNGYRSSLYTDPSIQQGVNFLNYEKNSLIVFHFLRKLKILYGELLEVVLSVL